MVSPPSPLLGQRYLFSQFPLISNGRDTSCFCLLYTKTTGCGLRQQKLIPHLSGDEKLLAGLVSSEVDWLSVQMASFSLHLPLLFSLYKDTFVS